MNEAFSVEQIENVKNCLTLKKQFAYELHLRTARRSHGYEIAFDAAQEIARKIYPFSCSVQASAYIAIEWAKDPIVINTYLQIKEGEAQGLFLPNKAQIVMETVRMLNDLDVEIKNFKGSKRSKEFKKIISLRSTIVDVTSLLNDLMGWNFEG